MSYFHSKFICKDFLPYWLQPGGFISKPVYENFSTVVDHANDWLQENRKWKVTTCESVEFKYKGEDMDFSKMTYLEYGNINTKYIRGIRLWLTELEVESDNPQKICYLNLIPKRVEDGGIFASPSFETLDDVIEKFHSMIRLNPLPGRIITVESQEIKLKGLEGEIDPERSYWTEQGNHCKKFVFVIRIFYELMSTNPEEIGLKDFIPDKLESGGIFSMPRYEPFSTLVEKASNWCAQQIGIRLCNIQSVEIKKKSGEKVDTHKMEYTEHGDRRTSYVRILRIAYAKPPANQYLDNISMNIGRLVCKTFVPEKISNGLFSSEYENLPTMDEKISAWIKSQGVCVLSAETSALRMNTGGKVRHGTEATFTYNRAEKNEYWIFVILLYLKV